MTNDRTACPDCDAPLPADSPQSLCPACLMRQALASRTIDGDGPAAAQPPAPEEIAAKFPQLEILECLGRGGMGVVYKARQKSLNRLVAIKILAPEREHDARFAERFACEAELLARLSHPHIVTIHDFGEAGGLFYLVMEFVDGVNLRDLLRDGKLEPEQALAIVPPVCEALQYAHDKGIVHRDIKPENLLLDREGRIKIADFGIAGLMGTPGETAGTPPYMAPEQQRGSVDRRADIYALGVVLYEMLTGERPGVEVIAPSKKVQIDVRLDEVVLKALEKEPELRFQDASVFKTQVETISAGIKGVAPAKPEVVPDERPPARTRGENSAGKSKSTALGRVAFGLFLAAVLAGTSLWDAIHEQFLMISVAVMTLLACIMGILSWSTGPGKFTAVVSGMWFLGWLVFTIGFFSPWGSLHQFTGGRLYPRLQVPEGYGGFVVVAFGQAGYPELPVRGKHQILRFPTDGILITSSASRFGGGADHAVESYDLETGDCHGSRLSSHRETFGVRETADGIRFGYQAWEVGGDRYWQTNDAGDYRGKLDEVERRLRSRATEGKLPEDLRAMIGQPKPPGTNATGPSTEPPGDGASPSAATIEASVTGSVARPGERRLPPDSTLLDALAAAGGWAADADIHAISVVAGPGESSMHDLKAILEGRAINPALSTGASVVVSKRQP